MIVLLSLSSFGGTTAPAATTVVAQTTANLLAGHEKELAAVTDAPTSPNGVSVTATTITADSEKVTVELFNSITSELSSIGLSIAYLTKSQAKLQTIKTSIDTYFKTKKKLCTTAAETAGFLCVEGTSPGAKAVKVLMDVGAPVLGVISSAQKACSSTAALTSMASTALTVAKGVCVTAKATCDMSCSSTLTLLASINTQLQAFQAGLPLEASATWVEFECAGMAALSPPCKSVEAAQASVPPRVTAVFTSLKTESTPTPGTATNIAAKCTGYSKDIVLMAVNIASLLAAKSSADKCSDSLKSSTAANTTPLQYCETPANTNTQYCICLKDNTKIGCPGYVATALNTDTTAAVAETGVDVKSTGTANQFASGSKPVVPTSALGGTNGLGSTAAEKASNKDAAAAAVNAGLTTGSSGGDSGSGGSGVAPGADLGGSAKDAKAGADKKWSFGSFSGGGGGGYGGGDSSGNGAGGSKLGQKDMDAIKRQIASEQLRAEVSEASGKSNWEKVRERYLMNSTSLLNGK